MRLPEFVRKADITPILRGHFATMHDLREGKLSYQDIGFFFLTPLAIGVALLSIGFRFRVDAVNGFLNAFAILTGLMLNLLVLVFSLSANSERSDFQLRKTILKQVFTNVCYCILVAICVVGIALTALSYMRSKPDATAGPVATVLLSSLTINFVLTLLMVMKRMYKLISGEFDVANRKKAA